LNSVTMPLVIFVSF